MADKALKQQIADDLAFLEDTVMAILLFGSQATGKTTPRSDIDVCIVAPDHDTVEKQASLLLQIWGKIGDRYDIRLFEELPLHIQIDIITNHEEILVNDRSALHEYFYTYRKQWNHQKHRNTTTDTPADATT